MSEKTPHRLAAWPGIPGLNRRQAMGAMLAATTYAMTGRGWAAPGQRLPGPTERGFVGVGAATREYRTKLMHDLMDREQLDALAFTSGAYIKFAINFNVDVEFFERPVVCIIPRNGAPFVILNELSTNNWRFMLESGRAWAKDAHFYAEHPQVRGRLPSVTQWEELVAARLERAGLARARIGTDTGGLARVAPLLPHLRLENVERQCQRMRWVKHEEEIAVMQAAASLADWAQDQYREQIRPGRLVSELDMSVAALKVEEAARRFPGADLQIYCWSVSGATSASPHGYGFGNLAGARIEKGDVLVVSVYPSIDGLFVENERTWFCGKPTQRQIKLFEAARMAQEAACEAAVTGKPISSIDEAALAVFEREGVADLVHHRTGHGLGLGGHDYPVDMAFNIEPLLDRMCFSIEPGLYQYDLGGFRHDDTVVVGSKPRLLTRTAKDLRSQTVA